MYAGKIIEMAGVRELFNNHKHPYTKALMKSLPKVEERVERLSSIDGEPPRLHEIPDCCTFAPRCAFVMDKCRLEKYPPAVEVNQEHWVKCWKYVGA